MGMNFFTGFLKGMVMGAGAIAPGVSGGALAVIFGLYDKITNFIAHINKDFKDNLLFFIPIGLGAAAGVLVFSRIIEFLFQHYETEVRYAFVGLMLGTLPTVIKEANKKGYKRNYIIPFIITLALTLYVTYLENNSVNIIKEASTGVFSIIIYGIIIGFGTIIPGISASIILMYMGAYEIVIGAISNLHLFVIFYLGIGFVISVLLFAKVISMLFEKAYGVTNYAILGLVLGSIISIFPGFEVSLYHFMNLLLLILCCLLSYVLSKQAKNKRKTN
jgi:putative membrane protein